jgi:hypothetical protein
MNLNFRGILLAASLIASTFTAQANMSVYTVNDTVGAGTVTGTITTDGTFGTLHTADIIGWDLVLQNGFGTTLDLTGPSVTAPIEAVDVVGSDLTASAQALSFNFSATDGGFFLIQQNGLFNGGTYYCAAALSQANCLPGGESDFPGVLDSANQQFASRSGTLTIGSAGNVGSPVPEPALLVPLSILMLVLIFLGQKRMGRRRIPGTKTD